MDDGLYQIGFTTPIGKGTGVAVLTGGKIRGGDSNIAYAGDYTIDGNNFTATVHTQRHSALGGMIHVLGKENATVNLTGTFEGNRARLTGTSPQSPGVTLEAVMNKIAE